MKETPQGVFGETKTKIIRNLKNKIKNFEKSS